MINVAIIGANGYTGAEAVHILSSHNEATVKIITSRQYAGTKISNLYPNLRNVCNLEFTEVNIDQISKECDVAFTALPHGVSMEIVPQLISAGLKVIDLSGDFRYKDVSVYEKWYNQKHTAPELLPIAEYGLCELNRGNIRQTNLVGNPGCYTTCSILALAPLLSNKTIDTKNIIIDAKSGVSGAGRVSDVSFSYCETAESMSAYKIGTHRHTSEIENQLSKCANEEITLSFTPHLAPIKRGILATSYANLSSEQTTENIIKTIAKFYEGEKFVRVLPSGELPTINNVVGTNFVDIGAVVDNRNNRVVVVSCLDNLIKGASGQAVQCMNLMNGIDEQTGLV